MVGRALQNTLRLLVLTILILLEYQQASAQTKADRDPLYSLEVVTNPADVEIFIRKMSEVADLSKFAYRLDPTGPRKSDILIQLWQYDFHAIVVSQPTSPGVYSVFIYKTEKDDPTPNEVAKSIVEIVKRKLSEINGAQVKDMPLTTY